MRADGNMFNNFLAPDKSSKQQSVPTVRYFCDPVLRSGISLRAEAAGHYLAVLQYLGACFLHHGVNSTVKWSTDILAAMW